VVLTEDLPASVTLLSANPSQGSCKGTDPVTCSLGSMKKRATATVRLVVRTAKGGTIVDAGHVDAREPDPEGGNNHRSLGTVVCTHFGTTGDDVLRGTNGRDVLCGLGGDDTIHGLGGDDLIFGGAGNDVIVAGSGADHIYGGGGADTEYGGWGSDRLLGGPGNDFMNGNQGSDTCVQGPGVGPRISCER
jgi:Ca2+-binding RTX toxin-like protein